MRMVYDVTMMRRTQILLTPEQHAALTAWAEREQISLSAVIRSLVDRALEGGPSEERRAWLAGIAAIEADGPPTEESSQDRILYEERED